MKILITGGAGFIGSALVRRIINNTSDEVINIDKLTYAGNLASLAKVSNSSRYSFEQIDICNAQKLQQAFNKHQPDVVIHLAAETHVDRSIDSPTKFIQTNILGTYTLLEVCRFYWNKINTAKRTKFRLLHVSTDEVYGDLNYDDQAFTESTAYAPSSPYSASKASSDHLVRAWLKTYGLPTLITNCSNNYGPYQFPEKLIPLIILNAIEGKPLPIYGQGQQIRDWLYVDDHVDAILAVIKSGKIGTTYNIGGNSEKRNIDVVKQICLELEQMAPQYGLQHRKYSSLIQYVADRPGHDKRYAINFDKIKQQLGWQPQETFVSGIRKTVAWYLNNQKWCSNVLNGIYQRERLGIIKHE